MGIGLEQFRSRIGCFAPVICRILGKLCERAIFSRVLVKHGLTNMATRITVINLVMMLLFRGGVELNPGPIDQPGDGQSVPDCVGGTSQMDAREDKSDHLMDLKLTEQQQPHETETSTEEGETETSTEEIASTSKRKQGNEEEEPPKRCETETSKEESSEDDANNFIDIDEIEEATHADIGDWTSGMIELSVCEDIYNHITKSQERWTSLVGRAGEGTTTLGYMVLKRLCTHSDAMVFQVNSPREFCEVLRQRCNKTRVVMLHNAFGNANFDPMLCKKWKPAIDMFLDISRLQEYGNSPFIHVLFLSRPSIWKKAETYFPEHQDLFSETSLFNLGNRSKENELLAILTYHLNKMEINVSEDEKREIIQGKWQHGIPHTSVLYSTLYSEENKIPILDFFASPLSYLNKAMSTLVKNTQFEKLFRCLLTGTNTSTIANKQERLDVRKAAEMLPRCYTKVMRDHISWAHSCIGESFAVTYGQEHPDYVIQNCDFSLIMRILKVTDDDTDDSDGCLWLKSTETVLTHLLERFRKVITTGDYSLLGHYFCRRDDIGFLDKLLDACLCQEEFNVQDNAKIEEMGDLTATLPIKHDEAFEYMYKPTLLGLSRGTDNVMPLKATVQLIQSPNKGGYMISGFAMHWTMTTAEGKLFREIQQLLSHQYPGMFPTEKLKREERKLLINGTSVLHGETLLFKAVEVRNLKAVDSLLRRHAITNTKNKNTEEAPLHLALRQLTMENEEEMKIIELLLKDSKTDLNITRGRLRHTPLHELCDDESVTVKKLGWWLKKGPTVDPCDSDGKTPFHILCHNKSVTRELLAVLLNAGADPAICDRNCNEPVKALPDYVAGVGSDMMKEALAGDGNTAVLMVDGGRKDDEIKKKCDVFRSDVKSMKSLLVGKHIGISEGKIYTVSPAPTSKVTRMKEIEDKIGYIQSELEDSKDGLFVFYYSGHFSKETSSFKLDEKSDPTKNFCTDETLANLLKTIPAKHMLLILDMCFSASANMGAKEEREDFCPHAVPRLRQFLMDKDWMTKGDVGASTGPEKIVQWSSSMLTQSFYDIKNQRSIFTNAIVEGVADKDGSLSDKLGRGEYASVQQVNDHISLKVVEKSKEFLRASQDPQTPVILPENTDGDYFKDFPYFAKIK